MEEINLEKKLRATVVKEVETTKIGNDQTEKVQLNVEDVGGDKIVKVGTMTVDNSFCGFKIGESYDVQMTKRGNE